MLRMTTLASVQQAKDYFLEALSRGEDYLDEKMLNQQIVNRRGGRAATNVKGVIRVLKSGSPRHEMP